MSDKNNVCPHCDGTGIMYQDYYEDDNMDKIVTKRETCLGCQGSGEDC